MPACSLLPHSHTQPAIRAGTPSTNAWSGTSLVTTAPAPTKAYRPTVVPQTSVELAPRVAPRLTIVLRYSDLLSTSLRGSRTLVNTTEGPQKTWSPSSTPS